jgi:hypothetical protein
MSGIITAAALGLGSAAVGFFGKKSAESTAKKLAASRPKLSDSPYLKDQLSLAESEVSTGMSAEAKAAYEGDLDRSLSTSLSAVLKGGGSPNSVGQILSNDQVGRGRLAIMKDNMRLNQINNLTRAQDANEEERQKQFGVNEDAPWKDESQANAASLQASNQQMWSGIETAGSGVMKGIEGAKATSQFNNYLKTISGGSGDGGYVEGRRATVTNQTAPTDTGTIPSPAAGVGSIDPNSTPNYLDTLLASSQ